MAPSQPVYAPALPMLPPQQAVAQPLAPPAFPAEITGQTTPAQATRSPLFPTGLPAAAAYPTVLSTPAPSAPLAQPAAGPTSPELEANETADLNWPLLQAIMQKHEQRQAEENAAEAAAQPTATRSSTHPAASPTLVSAKPGVEAPEAAPAQPEQPQSVESSNPMVQPGSSVQQGQPMEAPSSSESAAVPAPEAQPPVSTRGFHPAPAERLPLIRPTDSIQGAAGPTLPFAAPAAGQPTNPAGAAMETTPPAQANLANPQPSSPAADPLHAQAKADTRGERAPQAQDETLAEMAQPFPLESAWPVEQIPPLSTQPAAQTQPAVHQPGASAPVTQPPALAEPIRRALQSVTPGRASDSSVELITPRQPRPAASKPAESQRGQPAANESKTQAAPETAEAKTSTPSAAPLSPPAQPGLVQTEIGPLPADLWTLIGQPIPAQQKPAQTRTAEARPPQTRPIQATDEAPAASTVPSAPTSPAPRAESLPAFSNSPSGIPTGHASEPPAGQSHAATPAPITVQRSVVVEDVSVEPAAEQTGPAAESAAADQPAPAGASASQPANQTPAPTNALDLDELARQVYAELRNRLQMDWERIRRKF